MDPNKNLVYWLSMIPHEGPTHAELLYRMLRNGLIPVEALDDALKLELISRIASLDSAVEIRICCRLANCCREMFEQMESLIDILSKYKLNGHFTELDSLDDTQLKMFMFAWGRGTRRAFRTPFNVKDCHLEELWICFLLKYHQLVMEYYKKDSELPSNPKYSRLIEFAELVDTFYSVVTSNEKYNRYSVTTGPSPREELRAMLILCMGGWIDDYNSNHLSVIESLKSLIGALEYDRFFKFVASLEMLDPTDTSIKTRIMELFEEYTIICQLRQLSHGSVRDISGLEYLSR